MTTEVDICNMALARIGHTEKIASLTEQSQAAENCELFYAQSRDFVLRDFPWNFSTRYVQLAEVSGDEPPGWSYQYRYPSDCLQARQITDESGARLTWIEVAPGHEMDYLRWLPPRVPFSISSDSDGRLILTDMADAYLIYTARIEDTALFDPMFASALAWHLAMELIVPLSADERRVEYVQAGYVATLSAAQAQTLNEGQPEPQPESPSITARW